MIYEENGSNKINYQIDNLNRLVGKNISPINKSINQVNQAIINYTYDKRGNLVREEQILGEQSTVLTSFEYDVTNKMVKVTNKDSVSSIYNYNALGVLVGNDTVSGNTGTNDINLNLEPQVKLPSLTRKEFTIDYTKFIPSDLVESQDSGVSLKFAYAGRHKISADITTGNTNEQQKIFYHNDRLGSSVFMSDITGDVRAMANFDEWGNRDSYEFVKIGESQIDLVNSYTGHNYDEVLGVYYAKARMYNSINKRFNGVDLIKDGLNWYVYTENNPLKYVDLDGFAHIKYSDVTQSAGYDKGSVLKKTIDKQFSELPYVRNDDGTIATLANGNTYKAWENSNGRNIVIEKLDSEMIVWMEIAQVGTEVLTGDGDILYRKLDLVKNKYQYNDNGLITDPRETGEEIPTSDFMYYDRSKNGGSFITNSEWKNDIHIKERIETNSDLTLPETPSLAKTEGYTQVPRVGTEYHGGEQGNAKYTNINGREDIYIYRSNH